jgi:S1-C subfamily serine protease
VVASSPAEIAGLRAGDRILALDEDEISDLRSYSNLLRQLQPGTEVLVKIERGGEVLRIAVKLVAR